VRRIEREKVIQGKEDRKLQINVERKWGNDRLTKNKKHLLTGRQNRVDQNLSSQKSVLTNASKTYAFNTGGWGGWGWGWGGWNLTPVSG